MKTFRLAAVSAIALAAAPLSAASMDGFSPYRLSQVDKTISADDFQGRGVNTLAETKTVNYIIDQFRSAGLEPGGDLVGGKRKWTQDVPLLQSELTGDPVVTVQTPSGPLNLIQGNEIAVRAPQNGQNQIRIANAPLVFVGYGVSAPERNWDDFKGQDVKGKIIVVLINDPDFEGGEGDFGGKAMTYYGRWTYKYEEAARRGAAGVMVVHETEPASYGWNTVKNSNTNTQFDIVRQNPTASHAPFETWIQRDVAVQLFKNAGLDFEKAKADAKRRDFQPIDLKSTVNVTANANVSTITSHNVVGLLPGKKYPDETVIYSAHWDHLGIGKPDANGDKIYNGAVDNATGISQLIEQARRFSFGPRPERSIVFLAVTAEEKGLLGSEYFTNHPTVPIDKIVANINIDGVTPNYEIHDMVALGSEHSSLAIQAAEAAKAVGLVLSPDPDPPQVFFIRSDQYNFVKKGIPAMFPGAGFLDANGGTETYRKLSDAWAEHHYHRPSDDWKPGYRADWTLPELKFDFLVGLAVANARDRPHWNDGDVFGTFAKH
jgi:Zn-dependent M28 family amino/carboxypeptidase